MCSHGSSVLRPAYCPQICFSFAGTAQLRKSLNVVFACAEKGHLEATESVYLFWNLHHLKLESAQLGVKPQEE